MQPVFQQTYHQAGTLSAGWAIRFSAPYDLQLLHVSAVASNDSDATLKIGTSADDDAYLAASAIGDSGTPVEFERTDFIGDQYPHISQGTIIVVTLDHDGASGTAAADVTLVLTFSEG